MAVTGTAVESPFARTASCTIDVHTIEEGNLHFRPERTGERAERRCGRHVEFSATGAVSSVRFGCGSGAAKTRSVFRMRYKNERILRKHSGPAVVGEFFVLESRTAVNFDGVKQVSKTRITVAE